MVTAILILKFTLHKIPGLEAPFFFSIDSVPVSLAYKLSLYFKETYVLLICCRKSLSPYAG